MIQLFNAYQNYLEGVVKLMIWHVKNLTVRTNAFMDISNALDSNVDILRKTTLYDGRHPAIGLDPPNEEWNALKQCLGACMLDHKNNTDTASLENTCWDLLRPLMMPKITEALEEYYQYTHGPYECWRYNIIEDKTGIIDIHIANAYRPESPFNEVHRRRLQKSLLNMLKDARRTYPHITYVQCFSWVNRYPAFLRLFPESWASSFTAVDGFYGTIRWWGQYMNGEGVFHHRNALAFRRTGKHPYTAGICCCPISDAIQHIEDIGTD